MKCATCKFSYVVRTVAYVLILSYGAPSFSQKAQKGIITGSGGGGYACFANTSQYADAEVYSDSGRKLLNRNVLSKIKRVVVMDAILNPYEYNGRQAANVLLTNSLATGSAQSGAKLLSALVDPK